MKRIFGIVIVLIVLGYLTFCVLLFLYQRSFIYFPTPETRLPDASKILLRSEGETLKIWSRENDGADAIIYFGGNAEDVSTTFLEFSRATSKQALYFVNYRGYGGSTGSPSEAALFSDALAVYDLIQEKHPNISVIGRSLGSGVAAYLASERKVEKLVLITPYDSIENVAKTTFPIFPISVLLRDKFDSASRAPSIRAETLLIVAEYDAVIPRERSEALKNHFPADQVVEKVIPGTDRNSISLSRGYYDLIADFCN